MANIGPYKIIEAGLDSGLASCTSSGDEFENSGIEFIRIANTHATQAYNVTVVAQSTSLKHSGYGTLSKANVVKQVNAGQSIYLGPFKQRAFNDSNERVQITYLTTGGAAISTISSGSHGLKIEVLYLEQN